MSKKNFKGGLSSLLGNQEGKPKRGRPVTQHKVVTKESQRGTKENETRATLILNEELLEKLKAIAYWERSLIKEVVGTALGGYVATYEKKHGTIKPIPNK